MIESRTIPGRKYFFVVCTICGNEGPQADYKSQAGELALEAGWTSDTIYPGGEMVERYFCTDCNGHTDDK